MRAVYTSGTVACIRPQRALHITRTRSFDRLSLALRLSYMPSKHPRDHVKDLLLYLILFFVLFYVLLFLPTLFFFSSQLVDTEI